MINKKREEREMLEEAYGKVYSEMSLSPAGPAASGALGSMGPVVVAVEEDPLGAFEGEECNSHVVPDINALAAQAIAAITELATAAGANITVTVKTEQEDELPVGQFNTGYEDVEET